MHPTPATRPAATPRALTASAAFTARLGRRAVHALMGLAALALVGLAPAPAAAQSDTTLRIGFQKYGTLTLLKARGDLDRTLAARGITVKWVEFPAGPQLLEGLNVGSIDFGNTGEAPPIFAQAAGADLVYVAHQPPAPTGEAIVVAKGSPIRSVAQLKGKKVALNKGSNVHYLLVKALEKHGLAYADIQPVFLPPADARAAFERGSVDAWAIWDPFLAAAEKQLGVRTLVDGRGLVANHQFYLASRGFAQRQPQVVQAVVEALAKVEAWAQADPAGVVQVLAPQIGLDAATTTLAASRVAYGIQPVTAAVAAEQQKIADAFHALKLIPKPIRIADALAPQAAAPRVAQAAAR
jgi:sulfonate transport system substrate-binding protein